jgi:NAD(P)-dependent dehydrogenase (short-subunit alcohol dehydrogenase family)
MIRFDGRVAIVTGAGGGLGRTYAMEIARRGGAVVVNDLGGSFDGTGSSTSMADAVVAEIDRAGGKAVASYESVGTRSGGDAIVTKALESFGRVDIVINNAGHLRNAPFEEITDEILDSLIAVHLKGAFYVTQPAYRAMKRQGYGRIVLASSSAGMLGNPVQAAYGAAKAGLIGLMNVLSLEGHAHGVLCNALLPTATSRMGAALPPEQLADLGAKFAAVAHLAGNTLDPHFVTPLAVYLASEQCQSTHGIFSATWGRYAQAFLAIGDGWIGPRDTPPNIEQISDHWSEITSRETFCVPASLEDEFAKMTEQLMHRRGPRS